VPLRSGSEGEGSIRQGSRNRDKNTTLIAAITLEGAMGESMTVEGATDAQAFEVYVKHFLAPSLCEGQVVVLDGLGAHRTQKVRELIAARGADLLFLPSYLSRTRTPSKKLLARSSS
jgi:DDE superfamily endonuclease